MKKKISLLQEANEYTTRFEGQMKGKGSGSKVTDIKVWTVFWLNKYLWERFQNGTPCEFEMWIESVVVLRKDVHIQ